MRDFARAVAVASKAFWAEFRPSFRHSMIWSPRSTAGSRRSKALSIPRNRGHGQPEFNEFNSQCELESIANLVC